MSTKLSTENLREKIMTLAQNDPRFTQKSESDCSCIWVANVNVPTTAGAGWSADIQACDGKYYEVSITIEADGSVKLGTDVKEVQRNVSYEATATAAASVIEAVNGVLPEDLQWMPPGKLMVKPMGFAEAFENNATPAAAKRVDDQLQQMLAAYARGEDVEPYFDLNHKDEAKVFLPKKFYWGGSDEKTGGIRALGKWKPAGIKAATEEGLNCVSPNWRLHKVTKEILGLNGPNTGGLVPRSAFFSIQAFAKADSSLQQQNNKPKSMTTEEMQKAIKDGIAAGLQPLETRIASLEAQAKDDGALGKRLKALEDGNLNTLAASAKATVEEIGIRGGRIAAQDKETIEFWENSIVANAKAVEALKKIPVNPALAQIVQSGAAGGAGSGTTGTEHEFVAKAKAFGVTNKIGDEAEAMAKFAGTKEGRELYASYLATVAPAKK